MTCGWVYSPVDNYSDDPPHLKRDTHSTAQSQNAVPAYFTSTLVHLGFAEQHYKQIHIISVCFSAYYALDWPGTLMATLS